MNYTIVLLSNFIFHILKNLKYLLLVNYLGNWLIFQIRNFWLVYELSNDHLIIPNFVPHPSDEIFCNEVLKIFLTFFCNILYYVGAFLDKNIKYK